MAQFKSGRHAGSAIAADDTSAAIDLRGYRDLAVQITFGTCTGATTNTLYVNTSNDGVNYIALPVAVCADTGANLTTLTKFKYYPDNVTAGGACGFGRYVKFFMDVGATTALNYTIYWEAKG